MAQIESRENHLEEECIRLFVSTEKRKILHKTLNSDIQGGVIGLSRSYRVTSILRVGVALTDESVSGLMVSVDLKSALVGAEGDVSGHGSRWRGWRDAV